VTGAPFLITDRFELWQPAAGDLDGLVRLLEGEEMTRFLGPARADPVSQCDRLLRNAGSWALHGYGLCHVRRPGDSAIIGSCGIFHSWRGFGKGMDDVPEAGWIVRRDWWGQKVAGEVMHAVLAWFDAARGQRRIACMIEQGNVASERVAAGLGFAWYDSHAADDGAVLNLFERVPG